MLLGEIVQPHNDELLSRVVDAKIWNRQAEEFSGVDMDILFALLSRQLPHKLAEKAVNSVVLKIKAAELDNLIASSKVTRKRYVNAHITQDVFEQGLKRLSQVRQDCVRFALHMNWDLIDAVNFERKQLKTYLWDMDQSCCDIVNAQVTNMFTQHVFWETVDNKVRPLVGLTHQIHQIYKTDWKGLLEQFSTSGFAQPITKKQALNQILNYL